MGLFTWLTGQPEPQQSSNNQTGVDEKERARRDTPWEYRNCMNCDYLCFDGNYKCGLDNGFLTTEDRAMIAKQNCEGDNWEPRKHNGRYDLYIFTPEEWYKEY